MSGLTLILLVASVGYAVARWLRLPVTPLLLFAGLGLAATGLAPGTDFTYDALQLGLAFLLFAAGMELNPERFRRHLKAVLWVGVTQFLVLGACGWVAARALGFSGAALAYLAIALATSSTLVVVGHLKQQQQMYEPFARLVVGVLLVQDLAVIMIITVLRRWDAGAAAVVQGLGGAAILGAMALACQRWVLPFLLIRRKPDEETLLLLVLALLFLFMGLSFALRIPPAAGAFLAGFALASFPLNGVARGLLLSLTDFFQAIFFTILGSLVVFPDLALVGKAVVLALVVLAVTPPWVALIAEWQGLTSRPAVESGLLLAQTSEFALLLGLVGSRVLGHIPTETFAVIAMVAVMTMTLTPFLATDRFTTFLLRFHPSRHRLKPEGGHRDHVLVLGFGEGGMWVVKPLSKEGYDVLIVDDDPAVIEQLQRKRIPCIRGDGSDEKVLDRAGANRAKLILASMRRASEAVRVLRHVRRVPVVVRVFEESEADQVRRLGGIPILNSVAAADTFIEWYDKTQSGSG